MRAPQHRRPAPGRRHSTRPGSVICRAEGEMSTTYTPVRRSVRENYWQDWANAIIAVWFFISPWILQFGAGAPAMAGDTATTAVLGSVQAAAWNAWVLSVMVLLVAISAIGRMDFWQEYMNIALSF